MREWKGSVIFVLWVMAAIIMAACSPVTEPFTGTNQPLETSQQAPQSTLVTTIAPVLPSLEEETRTSEPKTLDPTPPTENRLVTQAKEDLAERLSIEADQIELVEFEAVVWPDGSLGCPQPGTAYKQVQQDGALIRLEVDGQEYEYHSGGSRAPFLCERPIPLEKSTPSSLQHDT